MKEFLAATIITLVIIAIVIINVYVIGTGSYKIGQIDALTGTIKYELITNPDATKSWEKIKMK